MESLFLLAFGEEEFIAALAMTGLEAFFNKLLGAAIANGARSPYRRLRCLRTPPQFGDSNFLLLLRMLDTRFEYRCLASANSDRRVAAISSLRLYTCAQPAKGHQDGNVSTVGT